jgi:hypothetical protein
VEFHLLLCLSEINHRMPLFPVIIFVYHHFNTNSNLLTYLLTPWIRVLLEKLTGSQLVKKFPAFYGTQRFITVFKIPSPASILSQLYPVHAPTSHFLKINLNIILPSKPGSSKWSLSVRLPHQSLSNTVHNVHAMLNSFPLTAMNSCLSSDFFFCSFVSEHVSRPTRKL